MPSGGGRREHIQTRGRSSPHKTLADSLRNTDAKLIVIGFYCTLHPKMQKVASAKDPNGMAQAAASSHAPYSVECPFRPSSTKDCSWEVCQENTDRCIPSRKLSSVVLITPSNPY